MTGRDLIIYILENHLEDEEIFKDGEISGLLNYEQAAFKFGVGKETILAWVNLGYLKTFEIYGRSYIPANEELKINGGNS